ncbi:hypothetical protein MJH12_18465, partial [bacterium]|nr:hypothetical protein [bacterium]
MKKLEQYLQKGSDNQKLQAVKKLASLKSKEAGKILFDAFKKEQNPEIKATIKKGIDYVKQHLGASTDAPKTIDQDMIDSIVEAYRSGDSIKEKKALEFIVKRQTHQLIPDLIEFAEE